jgi:anti-sigma factor RsiW
MTCRELIDVLDDYLDRALSDDLLADLERHLADCVPCRAYLATYRKTREVGAAAARIEMPDEMKARLRRFLNDHLRGA